MEARVIFCSVRNVCVFTAISFASVFRFCDSVQNKLKPLLNTKTRAKHSYNKCAFTVGNGIHDPKLEMEFYSTAYHLK
jgi:hypothetical protein